MTTQTAANPVLIALFPFLFIGMWAAVAVLLGLISGWYGLARRFPDKDEQATVKLGWISGAMGSGVNLRGVLFLAACPSGLRVGILRLFGPFCRPFFVPWAQISAEPRTVLFGRMEKLTFGGLEAAGTLTIEASVWERLSPALRGQSAPGPVAGPSNLDLARSLVLQWATMTGVLAAFFVLAPRFLPSGIAWPPLGAAIGFPAVVFGLSQAGKYFGRRRR